MFSWGRNKHRLEVQRCSLDRSVSPKMMELQGIMFARYFRRSFASTLDGFLWEVYRTLVKGITGSSFSCAFCLSCQPGFPTIVATPKHGTYIHRTVAMFSQRDHRHGLHSPTIIVVRPAEHQNSDSKKFLKVRPRVR